MWMPKVFWFLNDWKITEGFIVQPTISFHVLPSKVEKKFLKAFREEDSVLLSRPPRQFVHSVTG